MQHCNPIPAATLLSLHETQAGYISIVCGLTYLQILVAAVCEILIGAIEGFTAGSGITEEFVGVTLLPVAGTNRAMQCDAANLHNL